jgi:hypothetical protein
MSDKKKNTKNKTKKEAVNGACEYILVMKDGTERKIISEDGRYYRTVDGDFRKMNPNIETVKKIALKSNEELTEGV